MLLSYILVHLQAQQRLQEEGCVVDPDTQVSNLETEHFVYIYHNIVLKTIRGQEWLSKAERIRCPAPLPEGSPGPAIARMLKRTLSQVPSEKDEGRSGEAKSELHTLCIRTGGINVSTEEDNRGGESKVSSPAGTRGLPPKTWKRRHLNKGRKLHQRALPRRASLPHRAR